MKIALSKSDARMTLPADCVLTNDVTFDGEYNPHGTKLFVISNEYGYVAAVWASCEQDALDEAVDADLLHCFAIEEADADEDTARLGNAGEPFDLTYCGMHALPQSDMPTALLMAFAEARGEGADSLDDVKAASLARARE
jgi:hypothetical protein